MNKAGDHEPFGAGIIILLSLTVYHQLLLHLDRFEDTLGLALNYSS